MLPQKKAPRSPNRFLVFMVLAMLLFIVVVGTGQTKEKKMVKACTHARHVYQQHYALLRKKGKSFSFPSVF
jgi:hypothetical protein